jgi:hypothetical protein
MSWSWVTHYGYPSQEAMGMNGQTLLRVQLNGLKMGNKIYELEPLAGHSVKPPKAKPEVQRKENPTLVPTQSNPSNLMAKILSIFSWFYEKNRWLLDHSLDFQFCPT